MKDDFPEACEQLARSVADEVHTETRKPCGYYAKVEERSGRVNFTFKVGVTDEEIRYSTPSLTMFELKSNVTSWQPIFEQLVRSVLKDVSPLGYAQRLARMNEGEPEVPVFIDQQGKRHYTMKAETGYLEGILGSIQMKKGATKQ